MAGIRPTSQWGRARITRLALPVALVSVFAASWTLISASRVARADTTLAAVSGGAFGERVTGLLSSGPAPQVSLPASGSAPLTASTASANVLGVLSAGLLNVSTQGTIGQNGSVSSSASVAAVSILGGVVTADAVVSQCNATAAGPTGSTTLTNLRVAGVLVTVTPGVNSTINVPGVARVALNEQVVSNARGTNSITVNAVHVTLLSILLPQDIILAQSRCGFTMQSTIFGNAVPGHTAFPDSQAGPPNPGVELGVRFFSDVDGYVLGVRFYEGQFNNTVHTGSLWSTSTTNDGSLLATATFNTESAGGWQSVYFQNPVAIKADTSYIASYHTDAGEYAADEFFFNQKGFDSAPLHAEISMAPVHPNGVYVYGQGGVFPSNGFGDTNYWADVIFVTK